jgi:hypothetical protein
LVGVGGSRTSKHRHIGGPYHNQTTPKPQSATTHWGPYRHMDIGRGAPKEKKMKRGYIWQMAINQVGRCLSVVVFLIFELFFMAFLCVSQQGEFKNTIKKKIGESLCQKLLAEKVEKKQLFSFRLFPSKLFLSRFWPFLCMRSPKTP